MSPNAIFLILSKQVQSKWGRFLLSSGGIMIGIWAITLTTSLSIGLSDTIIKAINSQPAAKELAISKTDKGDTSFFDIREAPKFVAIPESEIKSFQEKHPNIVAYSPANVTLGMYHLNSQKLAADPNFSCSPKTSPQQAALPIEDASSYEMPKTNPDCKAINFMGSSFSYFYENNRKNWVGETKEPNNNELVSCFKCGNDFYKQFEGVNEPKDLIGKEMVMEYNLSPSVYESGAIIDAANPRGATSGGTQIKNSPKVTFKITSVVDDRDSGGGSERYLNKEVFNQAIQLSDQKVPIDKVAYSSWTLILNSYDQVNSAIDDLKADKYLAISPILILIQAVQTFFAVLSIVLGAFGFIALIASVFGIVNVMTISVLERQKEIGVLKALGAKNFDIFNIFLIESSVLGLIGWLLGIGLAIGCGNLIGFISKQFIMNNTQWRQNLEILNIDSFNPVFPGWLLIGTLLLAVFFTAVSGVFPAIRAARQNPVEVLRSE